MYALFAAPPDRDLEWQEDGVAGISRFLARVYRLTSKVAEKLREVSAETETTLNNKAEQTAEKSEAEEKLLRAMHQTVAKITEDFDGRWHFNTSIAAIMIFVNLLSFYELPIENGFSGIHPQMGWVSPKITEEVFRTLILMLAPFAPFFATEMWEQMGGEGVVFRAAWPVADEELARESEVEIPVQVNGKLVVVVKVPAGSDEAAVKAAALADEKVKARIEGKTVVKVIVVPGKLVNLVVK
jgi:leucyl-tRNA synthetase